MEEKIALCERLVGEDVCGSVATARVKVRTRHGVVLVAMCAKHKAEHDATFAELRTSKK